MVVLRSFEKRPWKDIAGVLGRPERELRRRYTRLVRELLDYLPPPGMR